MEGGIGKKINDLVEKLESALSLEVRAKLKVELDAIKVEIKGLEGLPAAFIELGNAFEKLDPDPFGTRLLTTELLKALSSSSDLSEALAELKAKVDAQVRQGTFYELKGRVGGAGTVRVFLRAKTSDKVIAAVEAASLEGSKKDVELYSFRAEHEVEETSFEKAISAELVDLHQLKDGTGTLFVTWSSEKTKQLSFHYTIKRVGDQQTIGEESIPRASETQSTRIFGVTLVGRESGWQKSCVELSARSDIFGPQFPNPPTDGLNADLDRWIKAITSVHMVVTNEKTNDHRLAVVERVEQYLEILATIKLALQEKSTNTGFKTSDSLKALGEDAHALAARATSAVVGLRAWLACTSP